MVLSSLLRYRAFFRINKKEDERHFLRILRLVDLRQRQQHGRMDGEQGRPLAGQKGEKR